MSATARPRCSPRSTCSTAPCSAAACSGTGTRSSSASSTRSRRAVPGRQAGPRDPRQLRHPQAPQGPRLARPARALDLPLHPDLGLLAECRRDLLLGHDPPPAPPRRVPLLVDLQAAIHRYLDLPQQRLSTVRMDHFRQSDLRKIRPDPCTFCLSQCARSSRAWSRGDLSRHRAEMPNQGCHSCQVRMIDFMKPNSKRERCAYRWCIHRSRPEWHNHREAGLRSLHNVRRGGGGRDSGCETTQVEERKQGLFRGNR